MLPTRQPNTVTVLAQPTSPAQICSIAQGSGTVSSSNVTNIAVSCSAVAQVPTVLTLAATPNPIVVGQPLTLSATVAAKPKNAAVPESKASEAKAAATGMVTFSDNGTPIGSAPLGGADGSVSLTVSNLTVNEHPWTDSTLRWRYRKCTQRNVDSFEHGGTGWLCAAFGCGRSGTICMGAWGAERCSRPAGAGMAPQNLKYLSKLWPITDTVEYGCRVRIGGCMIRHHQPGNNLPGAFIRFSLLQRNPAVAGADICA